MGQPQENVKSIFNLDDKQEIKHLNESPEEKSQNIQNKLSLGENDLKVTILKNLIKEKKIPSQILEDESFVKLSQGCKDNIEKIANILLSLYDIVIKPVKKNDSDNHPRNNNLNSNNLKNGSQIQNKFSDQEIKTDQKSFISQSEKSSGNETVSNSTCNKSPDTRKTLLKSCNFLKKIKYIPIHKCKINLTNHPINQQISIINEFNSLIFRNRESNFNISLINQLYKRMGLSYQKSHLTFEMLKNKGYLNSIKEKLLRGLYSTINKENGIKIPIRSFSNAIYKYCISSGNNASLVRQLLKNRWWWLNIDYNDFQTSNLMWTQWKKEEYIEKLPLDYSKLFYMKDNGLRELNPCEIKICNHMEFNYALGNKKCLYYNIKSYYSALNKNISDIVPLTFHIKSPQDEQYYQLKESFQNFHNIKINQINNHSNISQNNDKNNAGIQNNSNNKFQTDSINQFSNIWIIKPGENSNRGNGINLSDNLAEIEKIINTKTSAPHTYIIQKYIERPLLINKRKFDIRCFGFFTSINGYLKGYFYQDGYLRTSSQIFTINNLGNKSIHLTNEAIQIKYPEFGKYEAGNKLSYQNLQSEIETNESVVDVDFFRDLYPQIKEIIAEVMRSVFLKIDCAKRKNTFELFGFDFMIDSNYKLYLIEANINPCLEVTSNFSARFIPALIDDVLRLILNRICVDPLFQPPINFSNSKRTTNEILPEFKVELLFDEKIESQELSLLILENIESNYEASSEDEEQEYNIGLYPEGY